MEKNDVKDSKINKEKKSLEGILIGSGPAITSVSGGDSDSDSFPEPEE